LAEIAPPPPPNSIGFPSGQSGKLLPFKHCAQAPEGTKTSNQILKVATRWGRWLEETLERLYREGNHLACPEDVLELVVLADRSSDVLVGHEIPHVCCQKRRQKKLSLELVLSTGDF
jgi:hypothetical protein